VSTRGAPDNGQFLGPADDCIAKALSRDHGIFRSGNDQARYLQPGQHRTHTDLPVVVLCVTKAIARSDD
jgi:hypothetical protein